MMIIALNSDAPTIRVGGLTSRQFAGAAGCSPSAFMDPKAGSKFLSVVRLIGKPLRTFPDAL